MIPKKIKNKDFSHQSLYKENFGEGQVFEGCDFNRASCEKAIFIYAIFKNCTFERTLFEKAYLFGSIFKNCSFSNVSFKQANIEATDFKKCRMRKINFAECVYKSGTVRGPYFDIYTIWHADKGVYKAIKYFMKGYEN